MKNLLIVLTLILFTATGWTQPPVQAGGARMKPGMGEGMNSAPKIGKIKGKIIDAETNTPMEYANVAIYSKKDSKLVSGGITNVAGAFEIDDLPFGMYYVEANFIGFEKKTMNDIKIFPNSTTIDIGSITLAVSSKQIGTVNCSSRSGKN